MLKVDIVVPVYNAYQYTEECIRSIIKNTDLKAHTLILINDKSPDDTILPMLKKYQEENKELNIVVLDNEENVGFVKTVNIGMKYSKNDVILLNSDTEVTCNWVDKMQKCAYSNEYIATVTPLTNNGTIASVPNFGVDNELPDEISLEEYAKMIEEISFNRYPQLTTGNGFCFYIKRKVIEEIGVFDDLTFEKGYGEENDFCYRALDHGYTNVLCDNTFIYHKGTQSFKKENLTVSRAAIIEEHMELLRKKHPIYVQKTDNFLALNPLKDIQENIKINILIHGKKRILYLVNEWEENMEMTGGTSLHLKDIILSNMENGIASFVLAPDKYDLSNFKVYLYTDKIAKEIINIKTDMNLYGQVTYTNNTYKEMVEILFNTFNFDILHVHHFLFQTFDVIDIAKKREVYSIITLHDLYMSCPSINMVYEDMYCEINKNRNCLKCLKSKYGVNSDFLANWRETSKKVLEKFDKILVPSENTKKQFQKVYKDLSIEVVEHGVDWSEYKKEIKEDIDNKKYIDIAFVGAMAPHKGSDILKEIIRINEENNYNIRIHLIGKAEEESLIQNRGKYTYHGKYTRGELPKKLLENNIDLVCIFTIWPETYSYTLTETYMAKIPVLTFDIGAIGDRVKQDNTGWVINLDETPKKILDKIVEIKEEKEEYKNKINSLEKYKHKTTKEMQKYYNEMYNQVKKYDKIYASIKELINLKNAKKADAMNQYINTYGYVIHRYEKMRSTKIWKVAKKLKKIIKRNQ